MLTVIALGGNALLKRNEPLEAEVQQRNVAAAAAAIAEVGRKHALVVTHGNGPQVGLLALQAHAYKAVKSYPLDILGAETEGMLGYLIEQELRNHLPGRKVATLLTQMQVDPWDPAFSHPTKPIGPLYSREEADRLASQRGWTIARDGDGWRRVVPAPEPLRIIELVTIGLLVDAGVLVVCAGGGGIPVAVSPAGGLHGIEAVIDKDLAAALLATELKARRLLLLTDVDAIYADWDGARTHPLRHISPRELRSHHLAPGSMGPKAEAACRFVERTGGTAGIGLLDQAEAILAGEAGTIVRTTGRPDVILTRI